MVVKLTALQAELSQNQEAHKELQEKARQLEEKLQNESKAKAELQQRLVSADREKDQVLCMPLYQHQAYFHKYSGPLEW